MSDVGEVVGDGFVLVAVFSQVKAEVFENGGDKR